MKVFVLSASHGEDPPQTTIIGVFLSLPKAEAEKLNCSLAHEDYWRRATECDKQAQEIWLQWKSSFPKRVSDDCRAHAVYYDMLSILGYHTPKCFYREDVRARRIQELADIIAPFADVLPPVPAFPEPVTPPGRPIFSSYEMQIDEVEVDMAD